MQPETKTLVRAIRTLPPVPENPVQQGDTPVSQYLKTIGNHKAIFLSLLIGCVALAVLVAKSMSPIYQSVGVLELEVPPSAVLASRDGEMASAINGQSFDAYLLTQIGILGSDTLIRKVVEHIKVRDRMNSYQPQGLVAFRKGLFPMNGGRPLTDEDAFQAAKQNLMVRQSRLNNLIEVIYSSNDPKLAADFVNNLSEEYAQQNLEARWQMSERASTWLTRQLTDLRAKLESSENALQSYSRANGLLLVADKNSLAKERLQQLQQELSAAQSERMHQQSHMAMAAESAPNTVAEVLDNSILKDYQIKLADLRLKLTEYKQIYVPSSPKIQLVQAQISSLEAAYEKQKNSVLDRFTSDFGAASRKEVMLRAAYANQAKLVSDQDEKMIRYDTLKHEADSNRVIYESLLQKVKESSVSLALQATNVRIVDAAVPASAPYRPKESVFLGVGAVAGILLGLTAIALLEFFDQSIRRPGVIPHLLSAPELGVIPWAPKKETPGTTSSTFRLRPGRTIGTDQGRQQHSEVKAWLNPDSAVGDSFQFVMTSLLLVEGLSATGRLLVVTSAGSNEGKTTIAMNLGAAIAKTGRRVLIVDADLRRPRLHHIFGLPISPGLLEFTEEKPGTRNLDGNVDSFVQQTSVANLFLMSSGQWSNSEPHTPHWSVFNDAFDRLRPRFDTVLVDSSPLLSVPETRIMTHLADGVILVVRANSTPVGDVLAAEQQLFQDGCALVGTILNQAAASHSPYYARHQFPSAVLT